MLQDEQAIAPFFFSMGPMRCEVRHVNGNPITMSCSALNGGPQSPLAIGPVCGSCSATWMTKIANEEMLASSPCGSRKREGKWAPHAQKIKMVREPAAYSLRLFAHSALFAEAESRVRRDQKRREIQPASRAR